MGPFSRYYINRDQARRIAQNRAIAAAKRIRSNAAKRRFLASNSLALARNAARHGQALRSQVVAGKYSRPFVPNKKRKLNPLFDQFGPINSAQMDMYDMYNSGYNADNFKRARKSVSDAFARSHVNKVVPGPLAPYSHSNDLTSSSVDNGKFLTHRMDTGCRVDPVAAENVYGARSVVHPGYLDSMDDMI